MSMFDAPGLFEEGMTNEEAIAALANIVAHLCLLPEVQERLPALGRHFVRRCDTIISSMESRFPA